jgi:hypothetical protein
LKFFHGDTNGEVLADSGEAHSEKSNRWWVDVRIKLKLCNIFQIRGMLNDFVNVSFPLVRESLRVATPRQQVIFEKLYLCIYSFSYKHIHAQRVKHRYMGAHKHLCKCTLTKEGSSI